jgi:hypothetical protein
LYFVYPLIGERSSPSPEILVTPLELTVKNLLYWRRSSTKKIFFKLKKRKGVVSLFTFDLYRLALDKMRE